MPKGQYDRASSAWTPPPKKEYPPELVAKVRAAYEAGHSMRETAEIAGTTLRVLQRLMPAHGIKPRRAVKRDQRGPKNASWKGDDAGYAAFHLRVEVARGKASKCEWCGASGSGRIYEWANLTGAYNDVNDYARLCRSCHRMYDAGRARAKAPADEHRLTM